jgi:Domain of unknown function (DUF4160)
MFYGLIIAMYFFDNKQHNLPHIHVFYGDEEAIFEIPDGNLIDGDLPNNKLKLIAAWIEIHKEDLMANWKLAVAGQQIYKIDPLK